jgi:hypothetical protein
MSQTTSDPFLKPERLPSWVRDLPEVSRETTVPLPPWHERLLQLVRPTVQEHKRVVMGVGGALLFGLGMLLAWPSAKKPEAHAAVAKAAAPVAAPVAPAVPVAALAVAAPAPSAKAEPAPRRATTAAASKRKKTASGARASNKSLAAKPVAKSAPARRPAR